MGYLVYPDNNIISDSSRIRYRKLRYAHTDRELGSVNQTHFCWLYRTLNTYINTMVNPESSHVRIGWISVISVDFSVILVDFSVISVDFSVISVDITWYQWDTSFPFCDITLQWHICSVISVDFSVISVDISGISISPSVISHSKTEITLNQTDIKPNYSGF